MFSSNQLLPNIYVPTFEMKVEGKGLELDIARNILEIGVTERLNPPNQFSFRLNDPTLKFINREDGLFTEGKRVEIAIGFVGNMRKMIVGEISALTADFPSSGPATLEVQGFDLLHRLTRGTVYRRFAGSTPDSGLPDSQIVNRIAEEMGLRPSVDSTPMRTKARVQDYMTNLSFLEELARVNGYFLWVEEDTLYFKQKRPTPGRLQLEWRRTLMSFSPRLSTAGQVKAVEVRGWDPLQKQSFSARAERSMASTAELSSTGQQQLVRGTGGRSELVITDAPVSSAQEAQALAESVLADRQQTAFTGSGTSVGHPDMRVGTILELSGIARFSGNYAVTEVTHTVSDSGYQTSFQVNSAQVGTAPILSESLTDSSSRDRSRTYGVFVSTVISNQDPQHLGRVLVKLPGRSDDEIGHWARMAVPMAGPERGIFFLPEEKDEVLIAFEEGKLECPYVLGGLWNGKDKPPAKNEDGTNNLRLIKSRSGHLVRFDDTDGSEKIEIIDRSGKNQIAIGIVADDDKKRQVIAIQSSQDISLEAPQGTIELNAKNIELVSTAETKIKAKGMNLDGRPGDTNIKGKTINLN